jgi:hypothetical protein
MYKLCCVFEGKADVAFNMYMMKCMKLFYAQNVWRQLVF